MENASRRRGVIQTFVSSAHTRATYANHCHTTPYTPNFHRGQSSAVSPSTCVLLWSPYIYFACNISSFLRIHINLLASTFASFDFFARSRIFVSWRRAVSEFRPFGSEGILYRAATYEDYVHDSADTANDARYPA
ncbi:hypothetical protein EV121DRAFT_294639 [Schizophyllum commune]